MHQELEQKLYDDFPELYRGRNKSLKESSMCFGFSCGDGWFQIIYDLSADIMAIVNEEGIAVPEVRQVKEKLGGFCFYLDGVNEKINRRIMQATALSLETCEVCGAPGRKSSGVWIRTLCDEHASKEGF